jgi:hypothetical protein
MKLVISASPGELGEEKHEIPSGTEKIVLTVEAADNTKTISALTWKLKLGGGSDVDASPESTEPASGSGTKVVATFVAPTEAATYTVAGKVDPGSGIEDAEAATISVSIGAAEPAEPAPKPQPIDDKVSQVSIGEYDPTFTYLVGGIAAIVGFIAVAYFWNPVAAVAQGLFASEAVVDGVQATAGTAMQRLRTIAVLGTLGLGALGIIWGSWLMSIETRGRTRLPAAVVKKSEKAGGKTNVRSGVAGATADPLGAMAKAVAEAVAVVTEKFRVLRGSMAVLLIGFLLLIAGLVFTAIAIPT